MTDLDFRLRNWGRVVRVYDHDPHGSAGSLEGAYRSPQHWYPEDPKAPAPDLHDAFRVELAVAILRTKSQVLLRARYVYLLRDAALRKEVSVGSHPEWRLRTWSDIDSAYFAARLDLEQALALPAVLRRKRAVALARRILGTIPAREPYPYLGSQENAPRPDLSRSSA